MPFPVRCSRILRSALLAAAAAPAAAQEQRFVRADSQSSSVHHLELYDEGHHILQPGETEAPPYSPTTTCGKCHDVEAILRGDHFHAGASLPGRPQEPWILVDARTGTQIPLGESGDPGRYSREALGLSPADFLRTFGRFLPAWAGATGWDLPVDCMMCHDASGAYSFERRAAALEQGRTAAAATEALGLGAAVAGAGTPAGVRYDAARFDAEGRVFFDVERVPPDRGCLFCHSTRQVLGTATPRWLQQADAHTSAGMRCADCHRMDLEHHTVRGHEGEVHASGQPVASLSCRGCHLGAGAPGDAFGRGGRRGAPEPLHRGLPPVHLERLSCTTCHSGPLPGPDSALQLARAHGLGFPSQTRDARDLPRIAGPFYRRDPQGVLSPWRATWPAFFGWLDGEQLAPGSPEALARELRGTLRVRRDLATELADPAEFRTRLAAGLEHLAQGERPAATAQPVYVSGGLLYQRDAAGVLATSSPAAGAAWFPLAHDVRPARSALGAGGCSDCHAPEAAFAHATALAAGPAPAEGVAVPLLDPGLDTRSLGMLERTFAVRGLFRALLWITLVVGVGLLFLQLPPGRSSSGARGRAGVAAGTLLVLAVLVLGATALTPVTGDVLLVHLAAAGVFLGAALLWMLASLRASLPAWQRALRLLAVAGGIATTLPIALSMQHWLGTPGLRALLSLHGIAGGVFTGLVLVVAGLARVGRRR